MPKSLDEILDSPDVGLPERVFPMCVAGKLNAEFDQVEAELDELLEEEAVKKSAKETGQARPTRVGLGRNPRIKELDEKREALRKRMVEHTVDLLLRGKPDHEWRKWKNANPPRDDSRSDARAGYNLDALTEVLRTSPREYVESINDAGYTDEQWAKIMAAAAPGDMWRLTAEVHDMHDRAVSVPKSLSAWLGITREEATSS